MSGNKDGCQNGDRCLTHSLWRDLSDRITSFLSGISLEELVNNHDVMVVADRQNQNNSGRKTAPLGITPESIINVRA